jgi:hypothetical protein
MMRWLTAAFRYLLMSNTERYLGHAIDHSDLSAGCGWCDGGYSSLDQSVSLGLRALNRGDAKTGRDDCGTNCPHPLGALSDGLQNNQS